jgi:3-oxoacyl-[acyl-carrier protein] reductase
MITIDLTGKTALVTGGGSGIGLATVEQFARAGATVAINYLPEDPRGERELARLQAAGHRVVGAPGNVSKPGEAERMVTAAIDRLGRLDYLVNNAGTPGPGTTAPIDLAKLEAMTEEFWSAILNTNLIGPFRCTRAAVAALKASRGAVCSTASIAGLGSIGSSIAYGASKAGLVNLTIALARVLAPQARVNAVAPGLVDSPWTERWPGDSKSNYTERTMLRRAATPQDIADVIFFLCTSAAMVTGQTLAVDGGRL